MSEAEVIVLFDGYSKEINQNEICANCTCTLVRGIHKIIVDTMTAWDGEKILAALDKNNVQPGHIDYVISTHGHSDHIGNNNLFLKAKHIVGFSISSGDTYYCHSFDKGEEYIINDSVKVIPTPGHTLSDVSVIVNTAENETIAIAGDLFEKFEDIEDPNIWLEVGSEAPDLQKVNRSKVADLVDWIIPGHGPKFKLTDQIRETLRRQIDDKKIGKS